MNPAGASSEFRFEKRRVEAVVTLSNGQSARGCFFTASGVTWREGPERVGDLLNSESGFFPFEVHDGPAARVVLYHRVHVVTVALGENEAHWDATHSAGKQRVVSLLLSTGHRMTAVLHLSLPDGHDRVSDWTRLPELFRYVEENGRDVIVNAAHIIGVSEVAES